MLLVLLLATAVASSGCRGIDVEADRATYQAIAPEYRAYVEADAALDDEQKARRFRTVETWRLRLEAYDR